jgi:hypothetical protein
LGDEQNAGQIAKGIFGLLAASKVPSLTPRRYSVRFLFFARSLLMTDFPGYPRFWRVLVRLSQGVETMLFTPELEERIAAKVRSGFYQSAAEVVDASLDLLEARDRAATEAGNGAGSHDSRPAWERIVAIGQAVPQEVWDTIPSDLATNLDHYLYGSPKVESETKSD